MLRTFGNAQMTKAAIASSLVVSALALALSSPALALNPQPLPPGMQAGLGRALNSQPLPPGMAAGHRSTAIACRRVCTETRSFSKAAAPQCIRWQTVC
jgi:hypothetical protein